MGERVYASAVAAARLGAPLAPALSSRFDGLAAERRATPERLLAWAAERRKPATPLLWLHGASAGELLGAVPTIGALREMYAFQLCVTYTSPSAPSVASRMEPEWAGPLPIDDVRILEPLLGALGAAAIVFAKGDVWPGLTLAAARTGSPLGLINATVRSGSSRLRAPGRWLLGRAYERLGAAGAATEADAQRLLRLGARPRAVEITGDAAFDAALSRADRARRLGAAGDWPPALAEPAEDAVRIVAGSTWPADEEALLRTARRMAEDGTRLELVLVPHEPAPEAVTRLAARCRDVLGVAPRLFSNPAEAAPATEASDVPAPWIVDIVGVLAGLYVAADIAWVGGGFGRRGLHSVIEPAAAGIPVLFGPRHDRYEAAELLACRGGFEVGEDAAASLVDLARDAGARAEAGRAARAYVETGAGAAGAGARLIRGLMTKAYETEDR